VSPNWLKSLLGHLCIFRDLLCIFRDLFKLLFRCLLRPGVWRRVKDGEGAKMCKLTISLVHLMTWYHVIYTVYICIMYIYLHIHISLCVIILKYYRLLSILISQPQPHFLHGLNLHGANARNHARNWFVNWSTRARQQTSLRTIFGTFANCL
jgi:hypothetical protein